MANNTRSKKLLNDENYDSFRQAVLSAVKAILPHIIKEIIPLILQRFKFIKQL